MRMNAAQIADWTHGVVAFAQDADCEATKLVWDSREACQGCLYVALPGERVDGHRFVVPAIEAGATVALVSVEPDDAMLAAAASRHAAIVRVDDTFQAVTDLARAWRQRIDARVIGLTGSVGKTTTKNLVRDVLSARFATVATVKNQNNELGVPNTLLRAEAETETVVVEMGMRGRGQIESLCDFVQPEWGLITNVGDAHAELLGSRENIAKAKAELFEALPDGRGVAFVNAGNEFCDFLVERARLRDRGIEVVRYDGTPEAAQSDWEAAEGPVVWATDISLDGLSRPSFTLHVRGLKECQDGSASCTLTLRGVHNVSNACAAAAIGCAMGMSLDEVCDALARALPESGRQEVLDAARGFTVVNDAYNANPDSMKAALAMFAAMDVSGRKIAVLGDMGELGAFERQGHESVGAFAATLALDLLVCVGPLSTDMARAARDAGMSAECVRQVSDAQEALGVVNETIEATDAVLVKASHYMGLDRVAESLVK